MAIEARRGCGFRKVGGLYLVAPGLGEPCDRLPIEAAVCPCCQNGIKQARGWTWIDLPRFLGGPHTGCACGIPRCPLCDAPDAIGRAGLLWVGEKFYKSALDFTREAIAQGISRRIPAVPRGFKLGVTWVMLAHPTALPCREPHGLHPSECERCGGRLRVPGIFHVFRPVRVEKLITQSQATAEEMARLADQGITPVVVPDDDPDHLGHGPANGNGGGLFEGD